MNKICMECGIEKELDKFDNRTDSKDGKRSSCKQCRKNYHSEYYQLNKEKLKQKYKITQKLYREKNKDVLLEKGKKYYHSTKEKQAQRKKKYYQNNKQKCIDSHNEYSKKRKKNDPLYRLKFNYRSRICNALKLKGINKKSQSTREMLGCSYNEFRDYIQSKFTEGMSWENQGQWHIDHIIPLASAKTQEELEKLFHYSNCQPLWAEDNRIKSDKLDWSKDTTVHQEDH